MNSGLRGKKRLSLSEDVSPLEGAINIVDAMLVFACGLMLSLVIHWDVDLNTVKERINLRQGQEISGQPEIRKDLIESEGEGELYQKLGTVYRDPVSGKLFMLTDRK